MSYAILSPNGEPQLEGLWDWLKTRDWGKTIQIGKELLPKGEPTVPISTIPYGTPGYPGYDPYPKPFDIGSLLIPAVALVGGGLLVYVIVKAVRK